MDSEFHFIHSGKGDTILLRSGDEWGMVDACFTEGLGVRERVEELLGHAKSLRFLCITHFDLDHIRGLGTFLRERFSEDDGKGGRHWRIDQVITPVSNFDYFLIESLLEKANQRAAKMPQTNPLLSQDVSGHAIELLKVLLELRKDSAIKLRRVGREVPEFMCPAPGTELPPPASRPQRPGFGEWRIAFLGPMADTTDLFSNQLRCRFTSGQAVGAFPIINNNDVSRVMALRHRKTGTTVLLTGDSTKSELTAALKQSDYLHDGKTGVPFHTIKVSHHGAFSCHLAMLYAGYSLAAPKQSVAVICAPDNGRWPHAQVITDLTIAGVKHRVTGSPANSQRRQGPVLGHPRAIPPSPHVVAKFNNGKWEVGGGRLSQFA